MLFCIIHRLSNTPLGPQSPTFHCFGQSTGVVVGGVFAKKYVQAALKTAKLIFSKV